jgi:MobA/VirD2-like, nuclease domain
MIAKGNLHDGSGLAAYLVKAKKGERGELACMEGFGARDLHDAFRDVVIACGKTRAEAPFFHGYTRFAPGEMLDTEANRQLCLEIARREIRTLGMAGQPYAVSFHTARATGDMHMHIAVSRIARAADGRFFAIDPGLYKRKLKELSRALEREHGLRIVSSDRAPDARTRAAARNEFEEARRLGTDLKQIRNAIHDCLHRADNGAAFKAALAAAGLMLTQGDKRDCLVIVDQAGGHHALNKKLTGLTLTQIRTRLGDLDRAQLPDVATAKTRQRAPQPARDFSRASRTAAEPAQEAPETRKHGRAANLPKTALPASTAHEKARAPPIDEQGLSPLLFRRPGGDGFPQIARQLAHRRIPVLLKAFKKAAVKRLRRIRIIRLSREAWGAPDAHLQTTLNLFDQPGSAAPSGTNNNSRAGCRHYRVSENSVSPGL